MGVALKVEANSSQLAFSCMATCTNAAGASCGRFHGMQCVKKGPAKKFGGSWRLNGFKVPLFQWPPKLIYFGVFPRARAIPVASVDTQNFWKRASNLWKCSPRGVVCL